MFRLDHIILSLLTSVAIFFCVWYGAGAVTKLLARQRRWYERVLNHQLLIEIDPRVAVGLSVVGIVAGLILGAMLLGNVMWGFVCAGVAVAIPNLLVKYLQEKRDERLEGQIIDGATMMASGVRAGLNLVQAMELVVNNGPNPIRQEFAQLLREYQMGVDLNQAMRNAANRIGLGSYRLMFTAIEMHRVRGGDAATSMDRIAESIREIQRLEGKLDALTSQGRTQAWMIAVAPVAFLCIQYMIDPSGVALLFNTGMGRLLIFIGLALVVVAYMWIRRIMAVDI